MNNKRLPQVQRTVDIILQILMQNVKTDRQTKYSQKTEANLVPKSKTPISIGLPLTIHNRVRDKSLVCLLNNMHIGNSYKTILGIEKRIETAVINEMANTGGYCLPDFIKKDGPLYFAIYNIDFLEDSAYDQNTLHGTIIVVNQKQNEFAEPLRGPLLIPDKPSNNVVDVNYLDDPDIKLVDVKFKDYFTTSINLQDYKSRDKTWVLASYFSDDIQNQESRIVADERNDLVVINQDEMQTRVMILL